jgi:UDP-N-acetylglucosamine transferase subunit ALG13
MAILDITAVNGALKEYYNAQKVASLIYQGRPTFAMLKKNTSFVGETYPLPLLSSTGAGSNSFAAAQSNQQPGVYKKFQATRGYNYGVGEISREAMMASASDIGAFVSAKSFEIDQKIQQVSNEMSLALFRSGTGSIGSVSSISSGLITLASPSDAKNFVPNQALQFAATDGGTPVAALGYVVAIAPDAGTITVSTSVGGAAATPGSWASGGYLVPQGNSNAGIKGLLGWFPIVAPAPGDNFYGIDRSTAPNLAGTRYAAIGGESVQDSITKTVVQLAMNSTTGKADTVVLNPNSWQQLSLEMGAKVQIMRMDVKTQRDGADVVVGFTGFQMATALGILNVIMDRACPALTGFILDTDVLEIASLGQAPELQDERGAFLNNYGQDSAQFRVSSYWCLACHNTSACAVMQLAY